MTNVMLVAVKLLIGAGMLPPPCWLRVTWGVAPPLPVKLLPVSVIRLPTGAEVGLNEVMEGGALKKVTFTLLDEMLPAMSAACAVIVFGPGVRVTEQLDRPTLNRRGSPVQETAETPERLSDTLPVTETE